MPGDDADDLLRDLQSKDPILRRFTVDQLAARAKGNPRVLRALLDGFFQDTDMAEAYIRALPGIEDEMRSLHVDLLSELDSPDPVVRETSARLLCFLVPFLRRRGPLSKETMEPMLRGLLDESEGVRRWSAAALGLLPAEFSPVVVPRMVGMLSDPSPAVRRRAAFALMDHAGAADGALGPLETLTRDSDELVRDAAYQALLKIAGVTADNCPRIAFGLTDPSVDVRLTLLDGLRGHRSLPEPLLAGVAALLGDPDEQCIVLALRVLSAQPSLTRAVAEEIDARAHHQDPVLDARLRQFSRFASSLVE